MAQDSGAKREDLENTAGPVIENSKEDGRRFCNDVTPGKGRMLSCQLEFNREMNKRWSVMAEGGLGGSRENLTTDFTYRF